MTVRRYLAEGGWVIYQAPRRGKALDGLEAWLAERFRRHRGNADVVRQDLERERGRPKCVVALSMRKMRLAAGPMTVKSNSTWVPTLP